MKNRLFEGILILILLLTTVNIYGQQVPSLDKIIEVIEKTQDEILNNDSLFLKCEKNCYDILHSKYSGGDIPMSWELAWKNNNFYAKRLFRPTKLQKENKDIFTSEKPFIFLCKNKEFLLWNEGVSQCNIDKYSGNVMINLINEYEIFEYLGYNAAEKILTHSGNDYQKICEQMKSEPAFYFLFLPYLPDTLQKNSINYSIRQKQESVDNHLCWIIEWANHDIIWIDELSIIRKRIVYNNDMIQYCINYQNHKEIKPDVWLPFTISVDIYSDVSIEPQNNWGKIAKKWVYHISDFNINNVPESLFDVSPIPGTLVIDGIRKETYTITDPNSDPFA
jgi:hypothetical protein